MWYSFFIFEKWTCVNLENVSSRISALTPGSAKCSFWGALFSDEKQVLAWLIRHALAWYSHPSLLTPLQPHPKAGVQSNWLFPKYSVISCTCSLKTVTLKQSLHVDSVFIPVPIFRYTSQVGKLTHRGSERSSRVRPFLRWVAWNISSATSRFRVLF